jgi:UDP-N-acetylmuramoyl-L-alanyl-D-glutamate--2,6-diaminopimelate ligase
LRDSHPTVSQLLPDAPSAAAGVEVTDLAYDSRKVTPGALFFAFPGAKTDGRKYALQALEKGAVAVVSESEKPAGFEGAWIQVDHGRRALAIAARNFYGRPDERLTLIGITGTNGKTTTAYLTDSIFRAAGKRLRSSAPSSTMSPETSGPPSTRPPSRSTC